MSLATPVRCETCGGPNVAADHACAWCRAPLSLEAIITGAFVTRDPPASGSRTLAELHRTVAYGQKAPIKVWQG